MFDELERRRGEIERHRENSARLAQAFAKFTTSGQGYIEYEERVDFGGLTFLEEPHVGFGSYINLDQLSDALDLKPKDQPPLPSASGFVTEWDQDNRDFYTGAWVAVKVQFNGGDGVPFDLAVDMRHYFTFTAVAMKDVV